MTCGSSLAVFHAPSLFYTFSVLAWHSMSFSGLAYSIFLCVFLGFVYECLSLFRRKFLSVVWLTIYATDKGFLSVFYTINTCSFQCHKIPLLRLRTFNFFIFFAWAVQSLYIIFKSWYSIFYLMYSPGVAFLKVFLLAYWMFQFHITSPGIFPNIFISLHSFQILSCCLHFI